MLVCDTFLIICAGNSNNPGEDVVSADTSAPKNYIGLPNVYTDSAWGRMDMLAWHCATLLKQTQTQTQTQTQNQTQTQTARVWLASGNPADQLASLSLHHADVIFDVRCQSADSTLTSDSKSESESDRQTLTRLHDAVLGTVKKVVRQRASLHEPLLTFDCDLWSVACHTSSVGVCTIAVGGSDGIIRIIDGDTGVVTRVLTSGHTSAVLALAFDPRGDVLVSGGFDKRVIIWDVCAGTRRGEPLDAHTDNVCSVAFSPNGKRIASAGRDMTVHIWDSDSCRHLSVLKGHTDWVESVAWSPNGELIASAGRDKVVRTWRVTQTQSDHNGDVSEAGSFFGASIGVDDAVYALAFAPSGQYLAGVGCDEKCAVWDVLKGTQSFPPVKASHAGKIGAVVFNKRGDLLATCGCDGTIRVWEFSDQGLSLNRVFTGHGDVVRGVEFVGEGENCVRVSAGWDGSVRLWALDAPQKSDK
jgi:WD40 repeat protein